MKESSINEIFGGSENQKKRVGEMYRAMFKEQKFGDFEERTKTQEEDALIDLASDITNELAKAYGSKNDFDIPPKNVHILKEKDFEDFAKSEISYEKKEGSLKGFIASRREAVFINNNYKDNIDLLYTLIHEDFHMRSFRSVNIKKISESKVAPVLRRFGWGVALSKPPHVAFNDMDEAVIDEVAYRTFASLGGELDKLNLPENLKKNLISQWPEIDNVDMYYDRYGNEKSRLDDIFEEILKKNPGDFKDKDEVFDVFCKAAFTGNLIPAARIIEKTFGKGSFRKFGEEGMPVSQIEKDFGI